MKFPFFWDFDYSTGEFLEYQYGVDYWMPVIEMFIAIYVFFALSFIVLHYAVSAVKWAEKTVMGDDKSIDIFGGCDNE